MISPNCSDSSTEENVKGEKMKGYWMENEWVLVRVRNIIIVHPSIIVSWKVTKQDIIIW